MTAIYKRELKSYFQSMTGYVLIAFLVIFTVIYFMVYNLNSGYPYFSYVLMNINYVLIIIIPMRAMRCFAEERKNKFFNFFINIFCYRDTLIQHW